MTTDSTTNVVQITDTTFRDAHQSLMATRMRTADMELLAADMDAVGFHSMEVWGGATFDASTRFLAEDPWERLRSLKEKIPNTPLMMLLRGQSLVGYRAYAHDVVDAFVQRSAQVGIDIFRVFDALNDVSNVRRAAEAIKRSSKHLQLAICYSVTESGRLGGPIFSLDYFLEKAKQFRDLGADSICVKDMAGLLAPYDAYQLFTELKDVVDLPLQLHTHYTSGMASMTVLKAIEAGADVVDASLAPLALRTSQPAVESLVMTLRGQPRDTGLDLDQLLRLDDRLESLLPKYQKHMQSPRAAVIDAKVLSHQIPGGMASNLVSQLREADAIERLDEVLQDIPRTRKELGYPPLVTPMSQMVGTQAVSNVLFGRYKMVSGNLKDYVYGLYGHPPAPIDPEAAATILKDYEAGQPLSDLPSDLIEPEMEGAREAVREVSTDIDDVLTYALYPVTGMRFLRIKHGLDPMPDDLKEETSEGGGTGGRPARPAQPAGERPPRSRHSKTFNIYVGDEFFQVEVDPVRGIRPAGVGDGARTTAPASPTAGEAAVVAPMPGILLRYVVEEGQPVAIGDPVVALEAMKMENSLPSPIAGTVRSLPLESGAIVVKDEVLAIIAP